MPRSRATRSEDRVPAGVLRCEQSGRGPEAGGDGLLAEQGQWVHQRRPRAHPAQMTQRDGAGMAGERNTAGVHDGPRTDERWARAWVRKPGIASAGPCGLRRGYQPSLASASMCTGVGFSSDELRPTLGCEGARSCGVAGRRHRARLLVDAGTRAMYGSSAMRQQCYEGAVL